MDPFLPSVVALERPDPRRSARPILAGTLGERAAALHR